MGTSIVYVGVGFVFILLGALSLKKTKEKSARCVAPAVGRVVRVDTEYEENDGNTHKKVSYVPVFQYIVNGNPVESPSNISSSDKNAYKEGDTADILFNPSNPSEFVIKDKSEKSSKGFGIGMALIGIAMILLGFTQM